MDLAALEQRWQSISYSTAAPYRSLRIAADCIPELYLSLDMKGGRFLILQVPKQVKVTCPSFKMQNLSIEWHEETRFILIGLLNNRFSDLYNDLTLSMYNRIKNVSNAETYTTEFISTFHKWAEFFEEAQSNQLSETELKGLFGELVFLEWLLNNSTDLSTDEILHAWQGPFGRANDFIFSNHNVELKAKTVSEINVTISSEYQMQTETGKGLKLAIVDLLNF